MRPGAGAEGLEELLSLVRDAHGKRGHSGKKLVAGARRRRLRLAGDLGGAEITGVGQRLRLEGGGSEMDGGWLGGEDEEETRWASGGAMGKHGWDGRPG